MPLSYSQLSAYRSCPRKYEYAFIKKLKQPLTPEACFGVGVHSCLAKFGNAEIRKYENTKIVQEQSSLFAEESEAQDSELTLEFLLSLWHESFVKDGYASLQAADFDRKRGETLMQKFFEWWSGEARKVVLVEKGFRIKVDSASSSLASAHCAQHDTIIITGRFDRVEELPDGTLRVIDFKTGGLRKQESVDADLQLSIYALAVKEMFGKEASELSMLFLVDEEIKEIKTQRSVGELKTASKTIQLFSERIASKDYTPTPSREVCRGCPYRRVCDVAV